MTCFRAGIIALSIALGACAPRSTPGGGPFPAFAEYEGTEIQSVTFEGDLRTPPDSVQAVVRARPSRCRILFLPICIGSIGKDEQRLDLTELERDVLRVQRYYRDHGYYSTRVEPDVEPTGDDRVDISFVVAPGRQTILRQLSIQGTEAIIPRDSLLEEIPLREGESFGTRDFLLSADTIRSILLERGHAYADILRNYNLDTIAGAAEVEYVAIPGPVVHVDTIVIEGNERLSDRTLRRQITFREGDLLRVAELNRSQQNLYNLGMVNVASVRLAADTRQANSEPDQATVVVQVGEAAQYAVEASAGFGRIDCLRTSGLWVNRNFLGGGRRLEVLASLSRIGAGSPTDFGLGGGICSALGEQGFLGAFGLDVEDRIDYRAVADVQQPSIFGTQNQVAVNLHAERISEASAYIRESVGGRVSAIREIDNGATVLTATVDVTSGRTIASPAVLCVGFDTCTEEDLDRLSRSRWSNFLSLAAVRDASTTDGIITRGYVLGGGIDWGSPFLASDDNYLRAIVEGALYRPLQPGWVLATNLRIGRFLTGALDADEGYIPPERRFYAGGPNSVRGFPRNGVGPAAYVEQPEDAGGDTIATATGGTQMLVGSVELRMPSPWMSDIMRFATFIDAGLVSAPGADLLASRGLRFTPGAGVRFLTPVGPFRLDLAYNPYRPEAGPLYGVSPLGGLILLDPAHQPEAPRFINRFRVQFALGQAF